MAIDSLGTDTLPSMGATQAVAAPTASASMAPVTIGAAGAPQAIQQQPLSGARQVLAGLQMSAEQDRKTTDALMGLIGTTLKPMIEEEQRRRYFNGQQQVMQGVAAKEIIDQQPWFSRIFGKDATAQGATAMGAVITGNKLASDALASMPEDAKLSPQAYRDKLFRQLDAARTGDSELDSIVQQKFVENSDHLINAQAKANYKWIQDGNRAAVESMATSQADIGERMIVGTPLELRDPARMQVITGQFLQSLERRPGQSDESYMDATKNIGKNLLASSQFHMFNAFIKSGAFNSLPADDQATLLNQRTAAENKFKAEIGVREYGWQTSDLLWKLKHEQLPGNTYSEQIGYAVQHADQLNKNYRAKYGLASDFIKEEDIVRAAEVGRDDIYRRQEELEKIKLKAKLEGQVISGALTAAEQAKAREIQMAAEDAKNGNGISFAAYAGKLSSAETQTALTMAYAQTFQQRGPGAANDILIANSAKGRLLNMPATTEMVATQWQGLISNAVDTKVGYTPQIDAAVPQWQDLVSKKGGDQALLDHFGKYGPQMLKFINLTRSGLEHVQAFNAAFPAVRVDPTVGMSFEEKKSREQTIRNDAAAKLKERFGSDLAKDPYLMARTVEDATAFLDSQVPHDTAMDRAVSGLQVDVGFGGRAVGRDNRVSAAGMLNLNEKLFASATYNALDAKVQAERKLSSASDRKRWIDSAQIIRVANVNTARGNGTLEMPVYAILPADGKAPMYITGDEIEDAARLTLKASASALSAQENANYSTDRNPVGTGLRRPQ